MAHKDPEQKKQYDKEYYQRNKAKAREKQIRRRERTNELDRLRRQSEKGDAIRAYHTAWRQKNGTRIRIIELLGGKCVQCGFSDIRALQVDHVNGGGVQERKMFKNDYQYMKYVLEHVDSGNYQVLCANCNWIKRYTHDEHMWNYRKNDVTE